MKDPKYAQQLRGNYLEGAKRTIFLVPTRPLVKQQSAEMRRHFNVNVGEYNGDMNINCWDISHWNRELTQNQVIVMTPQIFLNILKNDFINFSQINLLIVDECHWAARKKAVINTSR